MVSRPLSVLAFSDHNLYLLLPTDDNPSGSA